MNTFCDWLSETIVISVYDSFFRNYIFIVLLFLLSSVANHNSCSYRYVATLHFTGLMQVCHQVAWSLLALSSWIKSVKIKLWLTCCSNNLHRACVWSLENQLASSLFTTCCRLVTTKPDVNASWHRLDDCKARSLLQISCNFRVFSCATLLLALMNFILSS